MLEAFVPSFEAILANDTLYGWAARQPGVREFRGRGPAYAVTIAGSPVVVRHSRHGGLLAPITRDLFLAPTRAPHELSTSVRLRQAGVNTPEIVGYMTYAVAPGLRRADVVTREIPDSVDLAYVATRDVLPNPVVDATGQLMRALTHAGALHPDLNLANILIADLTAYVLDVDRVVWLKPSDPRVTYYNFQRFQRSASKLGAMTFEQFKRLP